MSALSTDDLVRLRASITRGPWRVEDDTTLIWGCCDPDDHTSRGMGHPIAITRTTPAGNWAKGPDAEEGIANARAIAHVPDHLSELIRLRGEVEAMRVGLFEARRDLQTVKEMSLRGNQRNTIIDACEKAQRKIDALIPAAPSTGESHE